MRLQAAEEECAQLSRFRVYVHIYVCMCESVGSCIKRLSMRLEAVEEESMHN